MHSLPVWPSLVCAGALTAIVSTGAWASTHSRATLWGPVLWHGSGNSQIALTFDDGPTEGYTEQVLNVLSANKVKASFFVIGQNVEKHPQVLRRVHNAGHLIGNHTFDHSHYAFFGSTDYWRKQIDRTGDAVEKVIGIRPTYFRSPMGIRTFRTTRAVRAAGQVFVTWSWRGLDGLPATADQICQRLIPKSRPGDILVLHDGVEPKGNRDLKPTLEALPRIVNVLRSRGLNFVRLDELIL